ncbi:hypothetical protein DY000_02023659 [Brassica cretica]|uniref:Uncharacterized protein n=1 Tax=Brassica cretica TaxID=69181 RepID=A0ABQ7E996_BRACR|nr:hypothetical protein DY000_02023659 [Brassica cretica]
MVLELRLGGRAAPPHFVTLRLVSSRCASNFSFPEVFVRDWIGIAISISDFGNWEMDLIRLL